MYRIVNAQGRTVYRTDIFSRSQIGRGAINPVDRTTWPGTADTLDGTVSCSVVIDPDVVRRGVRIHARRDETPDLISGGGILGYGIHARSAGSHPPRRPRHLRVARRFTGIWQARPRRFERCDRASSIIWSISASTPSSCCRMAEFSGNVGWGYGDSHHFCIESSAGGRDKYRHFVRECHRRGIAVIQDVVYNHYDNEAERAQWQYDSTAPEQNIYYWYEGRSSDYSSADGGYLDNGSTGCTPRFWEEVVRQQFISSAAFLIEEMHVDGLRVDLTQAIHRDNALHADGRSIGSANIFGQKLLREWSRTLQMIRPTAMLIAEDHTGWDARDETAGAGRALALTPPGTSAFYHSLIGDSDMAGDRARLLKRAGFGGNEPLRMDSFAGVLYASQYKRVVFHESHDEAGNAGGTARTIVTAVNGAPLSGRRASRPRRVLACASACPCSRRERRCSSWARRSARRSLHVRQFSANREDILGASGTATARLFRFYQDLITLSRRLRSIRSHNIDILHQSNANRVIAFKRWSGDEEVIVVASLNNARSRTAMDREGCAGHSRCRVEGDLQQRCCDLWRPKRR